ncbi:Cobyrinic acid ac-diamide synthase [Desulfofarcimen acetoxidans DSM 771]|jgi:CO dehydrogenase maturation factor|uniref:Cobyrinic acid ac-diamide synthase n=1 Tax=Desulfofarcimen acetoxidans (strain ATCC 49208 / DSM 771 / KCTC 5769 / VKM B-1644 / 5575) TaxID=485916 RepID=C8W5H4_DESAS|nr:AAA family ATPase [Desulfofarcimen acetoxidans]ACV62156.1 Cobyrinic acid ac-diamide synthase [Desulfofarcimen acetoxidans DSM 771]
MAFQIAVAGKGGTGKTTFSSLVIRQLIKNGKGPVLAVDADANANLGEALGLNVKDTLSELLARINNNLEPMPAGMTKDQFVEYKVHQSLSEGDDVDLMVMGGPEGPGCYCFANNLVKGFTAELSKDYDYVVMDNEAGLEHLSRRTTQNIDVLFVVSDSSARGIRSAKRVKDLVDSIKLTVKKMYLIVTKVEEGSIEALQSEIDRTGIELIGTIPLDAQVREYDLHSKALVSLPDDSPVVAAVTDILKKASIL